MHDHDPDDAEMRAWLADGKAPAGVCPHCGSRISVVQRDGQFAARCSHRRCGASGPRMATLVRAVEQFCAPPAYVARHMGISVHPSSLTDVVSVLEHDRDAALARAAQAEAERDEWRRRFAEMTTKADAWSYAARALERADQSEAEVARLREQHSEERTRIEHASTRALALRQAAGLFAHAATYSGETVINRILDLLDAAPAAEWCDCGDEFRPGVAGATADQCGICASVTPAAEGGE